VGWDVRGPALCAWTARRLEGCTVCVCVCVCVDLAGHLAFWRLGQHVALVLRAQQPSGRVVTVHCHTSLAQ